MTTITSKFTKERLIDWAVVAVAERGRDLKDAPESVEAAANLKLAEIALASLTAEPVRYLNKFSGTCVTLEQQSNAADDVAVYIPLYATPPAPVDNEFIPKNLDKALGVVGVALPESKEEFNFQIERWIQRLIDRVIRYADEFKEQPAPVVPDERAAFNAWNNEDNLPIAGVGAKNAAWLAWQARASLCGNSALNVPPERPADSSNGDDIEAWFDEGWNACRAAMLQGDEPVSETYNLPELIEGMEVSIDVSTCDADAGNRYFGTVTEVSELYTAKNGYILLVQDAKPNFDVNGNTPVQSPIYHGYRPECECSGCKATARICAELNNEEAEIFADGYNAAMLKVNKNASTELPNDANLSTNSPVIPDGYALVPVEPTDEMIAAAMNCEDVLFNSDESFCVQFGNIYEAMLAAAPQH
ncbi:hypothetical protein SEHO0A_02016 [Salmonella enterica subsp. houtenae str. ATCC BAA-1581]|nr:hypothetical protein SEHO0A_02016 [Salmonella enterica subsp. houtenae str. ATCC BAA-1581]